MPYDYLRAAAEVKAALEAQTEELAKVEKRWEDNVSWRRRLVLVGVGLVVVIAGLFAVGFAVDRHLAGIDRRFTANNQRIAASVVTTCYYNAQQRHETKGLWHFVIEAVFPPGAPPDARSLKVRILRRVDRVFRPLPCHLIVTHPKDAHLHP